MTIGVGNLVMGGTGKTPMTEYLIKTLQEHFRIAVLSRGYGRDSAGIKLLDKTDKVQAVGDEPMQMFRKFGDRVTIAVGENRLLAIPQILQEHPEVDCVILDDVFQHRKVRPTFNIMLTNHDKPFYFDYIFPAGWLREPRRGARRADAIIVNKCPNNLDEPSMEQVRKSIKRYSLAPVFFTSLKYQAPVPFGSVQVLTQPVVLVSAIANNYLFKNYCAGHFDVVKHFSFEDHHFITESELATIHGFAKSRNASILTTEKDMVKLLEHPALIAQAPWFYLPVQILFLGDADKFHGMILEKSRALHYQPN